MFNFLSDLPPEIVLHVTSYLKVPDVLQCMCVCKAWHDMLCLAEMAAFWRRACVGAGLTPQYVKERLNGEFPTELFYDIRHHKSIVAAQRPENHPLCGISPHYETPKCQYAGDGYFVQTINAMEENEEMLIGEFSSKDRCILRIDSQKCNCREVMWARHIAGDIIYHTARSRWFRYNIASRQFIELTVGNPDKRRLHTIGYCRHCPFIVICWTEESMHSYSWVLYFVNFSNGRDKNPFVLHHKTPIPSGTTQYIPQPARGHLLPLVPGDCSQGHQLIVQGGSGACVYNVTHSDKDGIQVSPEPVGKLNPFFDIDIAVMVVNTISEMTLSDDEEVLGLITCIVYPFQSGLCLHIFHTRTFERLSSVKLDWKEGYSDGYVLAVNRLYALLAVDHSDGCVKLMHTRTGQCLLEIDGLDYGVPADVPMSRLVLMEYQGVYNEETMIDISNPLDLVIIYRQGIKNLRGIWLSPPPREPRVEVLS